MRWEEAERYGRQKAFQVEGEASAVTLGYKGMLEDALGAVGIEETAEG